MLIELLGIKMTSHKKNQIQQNSLGLVLKCLGLVSPAFSQVALLAVPFF